MRLFVAIEVPEDIRKEIFYIEEKLKEFYSAKWVEMANIHLTLKFLGEIEKERIEDVKRILKKISEGDTAFEINLERVGGFPNLKRPRVLWIGVNKGFEDVKGIMESLEEEFTKIGIEPEKRKKHPHITIGRVKKKEKKLSGEIDYESRIFEVKQISLIKSILTPKGAEHTTLERFVLPLFFPCQNLS